MKNRSVKKMAAVLLTMAMVCNLAACGKGETEITNEGTEVVESGSEEPVYTVNLVLYGDESEKMAEYAKTIYRDKAMEEINVDLQITFLPWTEFMGGKTELMYSTGEKFVTYLDKSYMPKAISKGFLADLTDYIEYAPNLIEYCGGMDGFDAFKADGVYYGMPFGNSPNSGEGYYLLARKLPVYFKYKE